MNRLICQLTVSLSALALSAGFAHAVDPAPVQRFDVLRHVSPARLQADLNRNKVFDHLEQSLAAAPSNRAVDVIVRYKQGHQAAGDRLGRRIARRLSRDRSVAARLTRAEIQQLVASGAVESIEEDTLCYATRDTAGLSFGATQARADFGLTGDADGDPDHYSSRDLTIAVIDTGIDPSHRDFAGGKVIASKDFVNGRADAYDDHGHGTHCASIAAGRVIDGVGGVAPGASLVNVKVLSAQGWGSLSVIADAVQWCIDNKELHGIDVLSMSLGSAYSSDGNDALSRMVNRAVEAGLVVCVAAGNSGPDAYSIGTPAAAERAITVGNMRDTGKGGFVLTDSSSRGPTADGRIKPDLCAPGTQILAAKANTNGYVPMTGTSMACPFVAGVAALMLQANPGMPPAEVKRTLKETAVHFGPEGENNEFGAGRLDGYVALAAAAGTPGTPPAVPSHRFLQGELLKWGDQQKWEVPVHDTAFGLALSLIILDRWADFDVFVYDPEGKLVASAEGWERQETLIVQPKATGTYSIVVFSYSGSGGYLLDISAGTDAG
jgi:serine protease AprX